MSTHLVISVGERVRFIMYRNNELLCGIWEDFDQSPGEEGNGSCSITVELNAGKENYIIIKVAQFETRVCSYPSIGLIQITCCKTGFYMRTISAPSLAH